MSAAPTVTNQIDPHTIRRLTDRPANRISTAILIGGSTILITLVIMALTTLTGSYAVNDGSATTIQGRLSIPVIIHLATCIPAVPLGAYVLWRKKGTASHKMLGRIWATLMMITAITSFFIGRPGAGIAGTGFSFIHIFSVIVVISIPRAIMTIRKGNVNAHYRAMRGLYIGLIIAGLFSFLPGRILGLLAFG